MQHCYCFTETKTHDLLSLWSRVVLMFARCIWNMYSYWEAIHATYFPWVYKRSHLFRSSLSGKCTRLRLAVGSEFLWVRHPWFMSLLSFTPRHCLSKKNVASEACCTLPQRRTFSRLMTYIYIYIYIYICRTAPLTSRCCILYIYSTNILLNILNMLHTLRFFLFKMPFIS